MKQNEKEIKIMEDKGSWVFTEEQIKNIKNFSAEDISKFYNNNYEIILGLAKKFVRQSVRNGLYCYNLEDLMQQVYIDIPYYYYSSRNALYKSIVKGTFKYLNYGGIKGQHKNVELEYKSISLILNDEDDDDMLNFIASYEEKAFNFDNSIKDREEKDKKIIEYLEKTIKSPKFLNSMFCRLFTDIPEAEIRGDEYEYYKQCEKQFKKKS